MFFVFTKFCTTNQIYIYIYIPQPGVYDVMIAEVDEQMSQRMLDITDRAANKYHTEYGAPKSNVTNVSRKRNKLSFLLVNTELEYTESYST